jgi:hypothetical protein
MNQSHNADLSICGPQAGWLHYCDGDNGGGGSGGASQKMCPSFGASCSAYTW